MGWRSWNAFGADINETVFYDHIRVLTEPRELLWGESLASIGYNAVGIDEGWEGCGLGINKTQHAPDGQPVINTTKFPALRELVEYGHAHQLQMGWYLNGCKCPEKTAPSSFYQGDIQSLHEYGFDQVKLDNCGKLLNMSYYAQLMETTNRSYMIENCHWGQCGASEFAPSMSDSSGCPTHDWCPFNMYRSGVDISSDSTTWLRNLQTLIKFQDVQQPLSVPGCWAYPDMLEVGMLDGGYDWNQAHFGAWCVTSSPLVLGANLANVSLVNSILPIIANTEAIAINQDWAGHPGRLVLGLGAAPTSEQGTRVVDCADNKDSPQHSNLEQVGWQAPPETSLGLVKAAGGCLANSEQRPVVSPCNSSDVHQLWSYNRSTQVLWQPVSKDQDRLPEREAAIETDQASSVQCMGYSTWGWWTGIFNTGCDTANAARQFVFTEEQTLRLGNDSFPATHRCIEASYAPPLEGSPIQVWMKPLSGGAVAVLAINSGTGTFNAPGLPDVELQLPLIELGLSSEATVAVRDIWQHEDLAQINNQLVLRVPTMNSVFFKLTPVNVGV